MGAASWALAVMLITPAFGPAVSAAAPDQPYGDFMSNLVTEMEAQGAVVGEIGTEWVDPLTGVVTEVTYKSNKVIEAQVERTFDKKGHAVDKAMSERVVADVSGGNPNDEKVSVHPPKAYFDELTAVDQTNQAHAKQRDAAQPGNADPLVDLGVVGRANAGVISGNVNATLYNNAQNQSDLVFSHAVYWYNPIGQTGLHSAYVQTIGTWNGNGVLAVSDPGPRDAMDVEYDPGVMFLRAAKWSPNQGAIVPCGNPGNMQLWMDSSMGKAWSGAYSQKPSHCSKYNILQVDIGPKSSASYGVWFNVYFNYDHTWNYNPVDSVLNITAGFGIWQVSTGLLGGDWNKNAYSYLRC